MMKQPVTSMSLHYEADSFNFTSRLEFEAKSNLLRSRSDTCLGKYRSQIDNLPRNRTDIDPWTLPAIDFSFHGYKSKSSRIESKKSLQHNKKRRNNEFVKIPIPKVLEKPRSKETHFVTSFRSPSARTARIMGVKEGMHPSGPYRPLGPHAFRGDDFRPDSGIRNKGKPMFITSYPRDPGNLELLRKSVSAHAVVSCVDNYESKLKAETPKPFATSTKQQPKWDHNLILKKEKYQRGISEEEIRMNRIMKQLSWYSGDLTMSRLERPDIKDYKTIDWLKVTEHSKDETTSLR